MAVDAGRLTARRRAANAAAARERRQKVIAGVGGVILLLLLVLQGPKTLSHLRGKHAAAPAPAPVATGSAARSATSGGSTAAAVRWELRRVHRFPAKDPFAAQVSPPQSASAPAVTPTAPAVRATHFVAKDPFVSQVAAPTTAAPAVPTAKPAPTPKKAPTVRGGLRGYVVILASIPVHRGRDAATRAAVAARNAGLKDVAVLQSSQYSGLEPGFFKVYSGTYQTKAELRNELDRAVRVGYVNAYSTHLGG